MSLNPDEPVPACRTERTQAPPNSAIVRYLYGTTLLHREHDLYVADTRHGRDLQTLIRTRLRAERFSLDDADEWVYRNWYRWLIPLEESFNDESDPSLCNDVVAIALVYRDTGIPNDEAFAWTIRGVTATAAVRLRSQGWNPDAYSNLLAHCVRPGPDVEAAADWVDSPIVWWRALRYLDAGFRLSEARDLETRRLADEDIDAVVDLLTGLTAPTQTP